MKNKILMFDVLNNDFTNETRGMSKEEKITAVQDYLVSKATDGKVHFAFNFGECLDERLKKGETFSEMIKSADKHADEDFKNSENLNVDVTLGTLFSSQSSWACFISKKSLDGNVSTCIAYDVDENGNEKLLGALEGKSLGSYYDFEIDSIMLLETDYLPEVQAEDDGMDM